MLNIALVNESTLIPDRQFADWLDPFQEYVSDHLRPAWDVDATLHFVPKGQRARKSMWWIVFADTADDPGALGFHSVHPSGKPYAIIGISDTHDAGDKASVTATHEIAEMLVDPSATKTVTIGGYEYALEVSDAVEDDVYALTVQGVPCSNFVLPAYFGLTKQTLLNRLLRARVDYDARSLLAGPCPAMLSGGYLARRKLGQAAWEQLSSARWDAKTSPRSVRAGRAGRLPTRFRAR